MKNHKNAYNNLIFKLKTCVDTYDSYDRLIS